MGAKLAAAMITSFFSFAAMVVMTAFSLLAMNGFSEREANYGLIVFWILGSIGVLILFAAAFVVVPRLVNRGYGGAAAAAIVAVGGMVLGGVYSIVLTFVCIGVALITRNYL